jgi:hypothetical protein
MGMAKTITYKINDVAHRRLINLSKTKKLPLGELTAYLVNKERKAAAQEKEKK